MCRRKLVSLLVNPGKERCPMLGSDSDGPQDLPLDQLRERAERAFAETDALVAALLHAKKELKKTLLALVARRAKGDQVGGPGGRDGDRGTMLSPG
jgi:hypothetical protein